MALITDPDLLIDSTEIVINPAAKTIQLVEIGNLSADGVTLRAVYSKIKILWNAGTYIQYPFPMEAITAEQFELINGWTFADQTTINLIRNGGFAIKNANGTSAAEYACIVTLGSLGIGDQVYFQQEVDGAAVNSVYTGALNECLQIYGDINNGDFDYRDYLKVFVREYIKTYDSASISDIGVTNLTYQVYRFPLQNQGDLKITHDDTTSDAYGVTIEYFGSNQQRTIGSGTYDFNVIIDGNNRTIEEIYEAVQSALRKNTDIDNGLGTVIGETADELLYFVGDILTTYPGVYIDNFQAVDTNSIEFFDVTDVKRVFPYIAAGKLIFSDNFLTDVTAVYRMYYTSDVTAAETDLTPSTATFVPDASSVGISGSITASEIQFDYDYDGNGGFDQNVTVVAIGLDSGQYVKVDSVITRSTNNNIVLTAELEKNYLN